MTRARGMRRSYLWLAASVMGLGVLAGSTGCGQTAAGAIAQAERHTDAVMALTPPTLWPATWADRKLFHTPTAYIYASSDAAAAEAEGVSKVGVRDFEEVTGATPAKGLIIVNDAKDALLGGDVDRLVEIVARHLHFYRTATQPSATAGDAEEVDWKKQKKRFDDAHLPVDSVLRCLPFGIDRNDLVGKLGFPQEAAAGLPWVAIVPTQRACKRSAHELTQAAMKQKDVTLGQRLLMLPWLPMLESIITEELSAERVVVLFTEDVLSRPAWDPSRKQTYIETYRGQKDRERDSRLAKREVDIKAKGGKPTSKPSDVKATAGPSASR